MSAPNISSLPKVVIDAFTTAAITTLQELIGVEAHFEQWQTVEEVKTNEPIVVAMIPLLRENPGSMSLLLSPITASKLASQYLPSGAALTEEIIDDVTGEFANVIAGQAKTILKGTTYHFHLSTPIVNRATGLNLSRSPTSTMLVTLKAQELGQFRLAIELPSVLSAN